MEGLSNPQLAGMIILTATVMVAIVIVLLIFILSALGKIDGVKTPERKKKETEVFGQAAPAGINSHAASSFAQADIEEETVAAISAAVAVYMDKVSPQTPYTITGITKKPAANMRPVWGFAGMRQNTNPF